MSSGIHPAFLIAGIGLLIAAVLVFFGCRARSGLVTGLLLFFALVFATPGIWLFLEFHPELLKHYKLILSVGHDEYWSAPMRDHLEKFIGDGGNVAFFSGNVCCWQVR